MPYRHFPIDCRPFKLRWSLRRRDYSWKVNRGLPWRHGQDHWKKKKKKRRCLISTTFQLNLKVGEAVSHLIVTGDAKRCNCTYRLSSKSMETRCLGCCSSYRWLALNEELPGKYQYELDWSTLQWKQVFVLKHPFQRCSKFNTLTTFW